MVMKKVYSTPTPSQAKQDDSNSINQIVLKLQDTLPEYGWEITEDKQKADLIASHAGMTYDNNFACDVAHCHGLYPTFHHHEPRWHSAANVNVIQSLRHARAITVPSSWVGDIIKRELNRDPVIVQWAIQKDDWKEQTSYLNYTLWNKTRMDSTCDPSPIEYLAKHIPDACFVSTFAHDPSPKNLEVIQRQRFATMQKYIQEAQLYLATTKETFGIGTLEAMACGVPILGYNWGGTADIVEHGLTGYLVEPHDLDGLLKGWHWVMRHRDTLGKNARKAALDKHYTWQRVTGQFAALYDTVLAEKEAEQAQDIKVSVIIPVYNYAQWLPDAVRTVAKQATNFKFELCIVDDGSSDNSLRVAQALKEEYANRLPMTVIHKSNEGVALARDTGIRASKGRYIVCLDADDQLASPDFLQILSDSLDNDPLLGVAYTGLAIFKESAESGAIPSHWPKAYNAEEMFKGHNQVPTCNMFRRRAYLQTGGYRKHFTPAEDAGLWFSMALLGWDIRQVSDKPLFFYRLHDASLSSKVRRGENNEPRWLEQSDGGTVQRYPMAAQIKPLDKSLPAHPVRNYDKPLISVIIPVGNKHRGAVSRALDSIAAQSEWRWEAIVVNDSPHALELPQRWAKVINAGGTIPKGASIARNMGIQLAEGRFLVFLDADDALEPQFLEKAYQLWRAKGHYVYSDWYEERGHKRKEHRAEDYSQEAIFKRMSIHAVTVFIPKDWVLAVGGFDVDIPLWEDSALFIKLAIAGYCGTRLAEPLFVYNYDTGTRRETAVAQSEQLKALFRAKFGDYLEGKTMAKPCCGQKIKKVINPADYGETVKVMLQNGKQGVETIRGAVTRKNYGVKRNGDIFLMTAKDAAAAPDLYVIISDEENNIQSTLEPVAPKVLS